MALFNKEDISSIKNPPKKTDGSVWKGPEVDGITFSLLNRFLTCRERFRLYVVDGLREADRFNHRLEYGNMWHICEEAAASEVSHFKGELSGTDTTLWTDKLQEYTVQLCDYYPLDRQHVLKWYEVCKLQFPLYIQHWSKHPDMLNRTPLLSEKCFSVRYQLPSGRTVLLRGKWDSVDLVKDSMYSTDMGAIWLQENKTKGDINEQLLKKQLTFDLQTMLYLTALQEEQYRQEDSTVKAKLEGKFRPIHGVRYNVVRRPLSGGKGNIIQHKPSKSNPQGETTEQYYARLAQYIKDEPETYFMRWNVLVSQQDIDKFKHQCLNPLLEQLCDWWLVMSNYDKSSEIWEAPVNHIHFRMPYGCYNPLTEGGETDLDKYLQTGSEAGLQRVTNLFPELTS
jgi:hypothetical protein